MGVGGLLLLGGIGRVGVELEGGEGNSGYPVSEDEKSEAAASATDFLLDY